MDQEIKEIIKKSEELAESASEKFQQNAFRELLNYFLDRTSNGKQFQNNDDEVSSDIISSASVTKINDIPDDYLIAEKGQLKHFVAWAVIVLSNEREEATVKRVRNKIDLSLSVSKPGRTSTSRKLADLCPKYMKREKVTEGQGYKYVPTDRIVEIFDDLNN